MNNKKYNFDDAIGQESQKKLNEEQHNLIKAQRKTLYDKRKLEDKMDDILEGFRFTLRNYAEQDDSKEIILFGAYLDDLLNQMNIKKGVFANYIDINPRNINKYLSGERKFNIEHALKLEKLFNINAKTILEVQLRNDLYKAKRRNKIKFNHYNLKDLLSG